ncbi:hypothetical protein WHT83_11115 [Aminobacter sp. P9b]|uniref:Lipoprotein n=1 Tax=Aminobacter niigataensis TaxID=83265 RepID=A0ABR6L552_9HYPH|nr:MULTISPECIES: hypothetical protein [Aminobacter]AWC25048.1 hypothetical protein CO731_04542 [Aminobacter sp. MSH1]MBB4651941.1 hypothetical protein [Aminobacter niigataensis]CAI2935784.1 conserved protein of unknown function [Aminobacter niigataensis]
MVFRLIDGRFLTALATAGFMLAVTGCQSGGSGGFFSPPAPKDPKVIAAEEGKILASELLAYCPNVTLRDGTAFFNSYAKGGQDDPAKLVHQSAITDVTRSCTRADGQMMIKVGVAGKVVVGPAGGAGTVNMPIRIAVIRGEDVLYSQLHKNAVQVSDPSTATQFVFTDANVVIPVPTARDIQIYAGFDEGPAKKKAQ